DEISFFGVFSGVEACATTKDVDIQQRVGTQAVCTVDGYTGNLTGSVEPGDTGIVILQDVCFAVGWTTTHDVVTGWADRYCVGVWLNDTVGAQYRCNIRQFVVHVFWLEARQVQLDVAFIRSSTSAFT